MNDNLVIPSSVTDVGAYSLALYNVRGITFKSTGTINLGDSLFTLNTKMEYVDMSTRTLGQAILPGGTVSGAITNIGRATTDTSIDGQPFLGVKAHALIYLPKGTPQSLIDATVPNNGNYVLNASDDPTTGTCDWFYVQDGCDYFLPHGFTAGKATYNAAGSAQSVTPISGYRAFTTGNYASVYLPYPFALPDTANFKGYALLGKANPTDTDLPHVFRFKQQTSSANETFTANTPYVVKFVGGTNQIPVSTDVQVPATPIGRVMYQGGMPSYDGALTAMDNTSGIPNGAIDDPVSGLGILWEHGVDTREPMAASWLESIHP